MEAREWRYIDKTYWPNGPWYDEPDKAQWEHEATGLPCLINRGPSGALCGYVGLSPGHPFYEVEYQQACRDVEVHGGLTYSAFCRPHEDNPEHGICHVVEPEVKAWWLGFDCAHSGDWSPGQEDRARRAGLSEGQLERLRDLNEPGPYDTYKTFAYVRAQTESLAEQLAKITEAP